ncbi:MAG: hypothetical protein OEZ22_10405 [Spirochaetia bacterium]|nr:hypothetical protein [Spirochaetia bacterium]
MKNKILLFLPFILILLLSALYTALLRLGFNLPEFPAGAIQHGPLMVVAFLGALISLERAVALQLRWAYFAPIFIAAGSLMSLVFNLGFVGLVFIVAGSIINFAGMIYLTMKQNLLFNWIMMLGSFCFAVGNILFASGMAVPQIIFLWLGYLILTILGERLELTRMRPISKKQINLGKFLIYGFFSSLFISLASVHNAALIFAFFYIALAIWFYFNDIIRATIKAAGQPRFTAIGLLFGYLWSIIAGVILIVYGFQNTGYVYDAFIHSIMLGFVFSMIFVHAPIVFAGVFRQPVKYSNRFYIHLILLQITLAGRVYSDLVIDNLFRQWFGFANVLTILLLFANTAFSVYQGKKES